MKELLEQYRETKYMKTNSIYDKNFPSYKDELLEEMLNYFNLNNEYTTGELYDMLEHYNNNKKIIDIFSHRNVTDLFIPEIKQELRDRKLNQLLN
jgi:hypothetical protein